MIQSPFETLVPTTAVFHLVLLNVWFNENYRTVSHPHFLAVWKEVKVPKSNLMNPCVRECVNVSVRKTERERERVIWAY